MTQTPSPTTAPLDLIVDCPSDAVFVWKGVMTLLTERVPLTHVLRRVVVDPDGRRFPLAPGRTVRRNKDAGSPRRRFALGQYLARVIEPGARLEHGDLLVMAGYRSRRAEDAGDLLATRVYVGSLP